MGPQSQTRVNQVVRAASLAQYSSGNKRQKTGCAKEFNQFRDCTTCSRKSNLFLPEYKQGHHPDCSDTRENRKLRKAQDNKAISYSYENLPTVQRKVAAPAPGTKLQRNMDVPDTVQSNANGKTFCEKVNAKLQDQQWCREIKKQCRAPLAMACFAKVVEETIIKNKEWTYFEGLTITVSACLS